MRSLLFKRSLFLLTILWLCAQQAMSLSFALDSIAQWGKFPKFCIDTYRWGDQFFNGYDTAYVVGTGYKFNGKVRTESWINHYQFYLPDDVRMNMISDPSTAIGGRLTYLAVSVGYDKNVSRLFKSNNENGREQFTFGFNCSLFAFNMEFIKNTGSVKINKFGSHGNYINPDLDFSGLNSTSFGFDTYYFFNHKRYSQAAAFNFSRIQIQSQGSWFAGISFVNQTFNFDFNDLPPYILDALPDTWLEHRYKANTKNTGIKVGYGYNWVFSPGWLLGVSESPTLGLKIGKINSPDKTKTTVTFSNLFRLSLVWNHDKWFIGALSDINTAIVYDKHSSFQNSVITGSISAGYRFNLW